MDRFPFWATLFLCLCVLILPCFEASVVPSSVTGKRPLDENQPVRMVTRKVFFRSPPAPIQIDYETNPPDVFRSMTSNIYLLNLPSNLKNFLLILRDSWTAHEKDFSKMVVASLDLELMKWHESTIVQSVSFKIHLGFLNQILNQRGIFRVEKIWDLMEEYIYYLIYRSDCVLSVNQYLDLVLGTVKTCNSQCFKVLLDHRPASLSESFAVDIWDAIVETTLSLQLDLSTKAGKAPRMFDIVCETTRQFGAFLIDDQGTGRNVSLNQIIKLQPILASILSLNSVFFTEQFESAKGMEKDPLYWWLDEFLALDRTWHHVDSLSNLADAIFTRLNCSIAEIISYCFDGNMYNLPQFLLMNSLLARSTLTDKRSQCKLFLNLDKKLVPFEYLDLAIIVSGFKLTWADIEEHLLPIVSNDVKSDLIRILKFILQVVESAPADLISEPWNIPETIRPMHSIETETHLLFDAARILLANHFAIPLTWTKTFNDTCEEATFKELADFMTLFVNKYRPDLGAGFAIKIDAMLSKAK